MAEGLSEKGEPHNDHNVYILGAGFSVDAGLPVMASFYDRLRDSLDWLPRHGSEEELNAVRAVVKLRQTAAGAAHRVQIDPDNIEELFSLAAARPHTTQSSYIAMAIAATLRFCRHTSNEPRLTIGRPADWKLPKHWTVEKDTNPRNRGRAPDAPKVTPNLYEVLAAIVSGKITRQHSRAKNTVITFNYDTVLEDALGRIGVRYSYGVGSDAVLHESAQASRESDLNILKLHGSVNWGKTESGQLHVFGSYGDLRPISGDVFLLPPSWNKSIATAYQDVWTNALQAIETATRIVIIGFSLPETDLHAKYLFAAGLQDNIWLRDFLFVDPNPNPVKGRAQTIFRKELVDSQKVRFESAYSSQFLTNPDHMTRIGRSLAFGRG